LAREGRKAQADFLRQVRAVQRSIGISESEIRAVARARDAELLPPNDDRFWRTQVEQIPVSESEDLDHLAKTGLKRLLARVKPEWLRAEAHKPYRLGSAFLTNPLHLVNGVRVGMNLNSEGPQRFARMLLITQDHLKKRWDLDFFSAAMFVPEVAQLGNSLDEIGALGPEAERKLAALPSMTDEMVSATVYELLVGAACVRKGLKLTMVPEDRSRKVPDYQITNLGPILGAIECKRRLGLTAYELDEAERIEKLYSSVRPLLQQNGIHGSIEVSFKVPLRSVSIEQFVEPTLAIVGHARSHEPTQTNWGSLVFRPLPHLRSIRGTRLYSPEYLQEVFEWEALQDQWDGLLCEVEASPSIAVELFKAPLCLKWRSESAEALTKKARGITSLWGDAIKQIPAGEIGFVYVAYPEGARPALADARTRYILKAMTEIWHRWTIRVPVTVVNRLYPRSLGPGSPDLIESAMPGAAKGQEFWLKRVPTRVFTSQLDQA
jgi:hypothetical protein